MASTDPLRGAEVRVQLASAARRRRILGWLEAAGCAVADGGSRPEVVLTDPGTVTDPAVAGAAIIVLGPAGAAAAALDAGADDFVAMPVVCDELLARLRAVLRRTRVATGAAVVTAAFELDPVARLARAGGREVHLTPLEWHLAGILTRRPGVVVHQRELVAMVWGREHPDRVHALRVHLSSLRSKLEPDPHAPRYFTTEPGVGLRFVP